MSHHRTTRRPFAFTLVELLVVISIFVLILAIGVPAFSSLLYSSDQSLAENALKQGLTAARDAAARSPAGQDAAAAFFYDQRHLSIVPVRFVGTTREPTAVGTPGSFITREVFAPIPGMAPVQLPEGWMVRAYSPPGRLSDTAAIAQEWYEDTYNANNARVTHWLFPETSFFDTDDGEDGEDRQTFIVRFEGATGRLRTGDPAAVLILTPSPGTSFREQAPWANFRADREADPARFVRRVGAANLNLNDRARLLGDVSSDTVLAKPLSQLAVYSERRLAAAVGARIDDTTGCLYQSGVDPQYVVPASATLRDDIDRWLEDRATNGADSDARIFTVHTSLGWLQELTGSRPTPP